MKHCRTHQTTLVFLVLLADSSSTASAFVRNPYFNRTPWTTRIREHEGHLPLAGAQDRCLQVPRYMGLPRSEDTRRSRNRLGRDGVGGVYMSHEFERTSGRDHKYEVVFVRHGQSTWNKANRFIGWTDTELTEEGEIEARVAGQVRYTKVTLMSS